MFQPLGTNLCCEDPITSTRTACSATHHDGRNHVPRAGAAANTAPATVAKSKRERRLHLPSLDLETLHRSRIVTNLIQRESLRRLQLEQASERSPTDAARLVVTRVRVLLPQYTRFPKTQLVLGVELRHPVMFKRRVHFLGYGY